MKPFPYFQTTDNDYGPTCLKMVAKFYGKDLEGNQLDDSVTTNTKGWTFLEMSSAAEKIGLTTLLYQGPIDVLKQVALPAILHWNLHQFVVLYKVRWNTYHIADPSKGVLKLRKSELQRHWLGNKKDLGKWGYAMTVAV